MLYFKNADLAEENHVSLRTIFNWIEASKQEKLNLTLCTENGKSYIANTTQNLAVIEQLVEKRRKYRNTKAAKVVTPQAEFYKIYREREALDLVSSLDIKHEVPCQYTYFGDGADYWDKYTQRLASEEIPNFFTGTEKLLTINESYLDELISGYSCVNIVDIGVGNGFPVRELLTRLLSRGVLGRYIAYDFSTDMMRIAQRNIEDWFGGKVVFEAYQRDISYDRFADVLAKEYLKKNSKSTANLVLTFGGTLRNLPSPEAALRVIHESMGRNDFFIQALKLDTDATRRYFDFSIVSIDDELQPFALQDRFIMDLLNIDESYYEVEMGFSKSRRRYIRVRLKIALSIKFVFSSGERVVEFNKSDTILLWHYWHQTPVEVRLELERSNFDVMLASQTESKEYLLTVARIKQIR